MGSGICVLANKILRPAGFALYPLHDESPPPPDYSCPDLPQHHFDSCQVLANRKEMLCRLPKEAFAEIGVAFGDFSADILSVSRPKALHLIDLWESSRWSAGLSKVQAHFADEVKNGTVLLHRGYSTDVLASFPAESMDWVYLDTVHDYATTSAELIQCERVLKEGGRLAGHDFTIGNPHSRLPYGVIKAVYEFCRERKWDFEFITLDGSCYFSFCLKRKPSA